MADPVKPPGKPGSIFQKKIGGIPVPVALLIVVGVGYLAYRHYHNTATGTSGVSTSGSSAVDPNAIDPATGLTYGAEEQAAQAGLGAGASTNGTGAGGVGGGISLGDLEGLISSLQGLQGATNYYYGGGGAGSFPTPTNPNGPGAGTFSQTSPNVMGGGPSGPIQSRTAPNPAPTGGSTGPAISGIPSFVSGSGPISVPAQGEASTGADIGAEIGADFSSLPVTQFGGPVPTVAPSTPAPKTPSAPYTTPITANPTGGSATKKQGVISVH